MKDHKLLVYGIGGLFGLWVLAHTWPFILGGLALTGLWCLLNHHHNDKNNHHRRPPRGR
jgi:hypothetical protein